MFLNKKYHKAIQLFINKLRKNNITCGIKIFDEIDYYTIFLLDEKSSQLDIIDKISYKVDAKFKNALCKSIHCEYLYDWFNNDEEIKKSIEEGKIKDITEYFSIGQPAFKNTIEIPDTSDSIVEYMMCKEIEGETNGFAIAS